MGDCANGRTHTAFNCAVAVSQRLVWGGGGEGGTQIFYINVLF